MNDKNKYTDESMAEEPDDGGFDSGKALKGFSDDEEGLRFGSNKEKEGYLPDFTDEMEYDAMGREKSGFFSRLFSLPNIPVGWLGVFLVVLVALLLFLPQFNRSGNEQINALHDRMKNLEEQWAHMPQLSEAPKVEEAGLSSIKETNERVDALEKALASATSQMKNEVNALKSALAQVTPRPAVEKPVTKDTALKKTAEPAPMKYHTVKAGENLFRISLKYGLKQDELLKLNNLEKNAIIVPGQKLKVGK